MTQTTDTSIAKNLLTNLPDPPYQQIIDGWELRKNYNALELSKLTPFIQIYCMLKPGTSDDLLIDLIEDPSLKIGCNLTHYLGGSSFSQQVILCPIADMDSQPNTFKQKGGIGINQMKIAREVSSFNSAVMDVTLNISDTNLFSKKTYLSKLLTLGNEFIIIYGWIDKNNRINGTTYYDIPPQPDDQNQMDVEVGPIHNGFWTAQRVTLWKLEYNLDQTGHLIAKSSFMHSNYQKGVISKTYSISSNVLSRLLQLDSSGGNYSEVLSSFYKDRFAGDENISEKINALYQNPFDNITFDKIVQVSNSQIDKLVPNIRALENNTALRFYITAERIGLHLAAVAAGSISRTVESQQLDSTDDGTVVNNGGSDIRQGTALMSDISQDPVWSENNIYSDFAQGVGRDVIRIFIQDINNPTIPNESVIFANFVGSTKLSPSYNLFKSTPLSNFNLGYIHKKDIMDPFSILMYIDEYSIISKPIIPDLGGNVSSPYALAAAAQGGRLEEINTQREFGGLTNSYTCKGSVNKSVWEFSPGPPISQKLSKFLRAPNENLSLANAEIILENALTVLRGTLPEASTNGYRAIAAIATTGTSEILIAIINFNRTGFESVSEFLLDERYTGSNKDKNAMFCFYDINDNNEEVVNYIALVVNTTTKKRKWYDPRRLADAALNWVADAFPGLGGQIWVRLPSVGNSSNPNERTYNQILPPYGIIQNTRDNYKDYELGTGFNDDTNQKEFEAKWIKVLFEEKVKVIKEIDQATGEEVQVYRLPIVHIDMYDGSERNTEIENGFKLPNQSIVDYDLALQYYHSKESKLYTEKGERCWFSRSNGSNHATPNITKPMGFSNNSFYTLTEGEKTRRYWVERWTAQKGDMIPHLINYWLREILLFENGDDLSTSAEDIISEHFILTGQLDWFLNQLRPEDIIQDYDVLDFEVRARSEIRSLGDLLADISNGGTFFYKIPGAFLAKSLSPPNMSSSHIWAFKIDAKTNNMIESPFTVPLNFDDQDTHIIDRDNLRGEKVLNHTYYVANQQTGVLEPQISQVNIPPFYVRQEELIEKNLRYSKGKIVDLKLEIMKSESDLTNPENLYERWGFGTIYGDLTNEQILELTYEDQLKALEEIEEIKRHNRAVRNFAVVSDGFRGVLTGEEIQNQKIVDESRLWPYLSFKYENIEREIPPVTPSPEEAAIAAEAGPVQPTLQTFNDDPNAPNKLIYNNLTRPVDNTFDAETGQSYDNEGTYVPPNTKAANIRYYRVGNTEKYYTISFITSKGDDNVNTIFDSQNKNTNEGRNTLSNNYSKKGYLQPRYDLKRKAFVYPVFSYHLMEPQFIEPEVLYGGPFILGIDRDPIENFKLIYKTVNPSINVDGLSNNRLREIFNDIVENFPADSYYYTIEKMPEFEKVKRHEDYLGINKRGVIFYQWNYAIPLPRYDVAKGLWYWKLFSQSSSEVKRFLIDTSKIKSDVVNNIIDPTVVEELNRVTNIYKKPPTSGYNEGRA